MTERVAESTPAKQDRDEVFVDSTRSICPVCKVVVDAQVNIRDDKVYLRKRCREHGEFEALVYGDARMYVDSARFNKPGTIPLTFQTEVKDGCPSDCGLCPEHKQHACLGIIEVNTGCNLDCPICFADSGHQPDGYAITLEQCARMLDVFVASEGEAEVVMFSGGEPTIHMDILAMIDLAQRRPIKAVNLNTNGIRLASDKRFVAGLGARNRPGRAVNVYLQFDGLDEQTHRTIRGRDLRDIKRRALDNCAEAGLTVTLVAAIERGVNEHEIGPVITFGLGHPAVRSIAFQPVTHSGRHAVFDPMTRLTNSDVLHLIAEQLPEWFSTDDFFGVPCCFPTCRSITYLITDGVPGDPGFGLVPIPRLLNVEDYLDYVSNRVLPDDGVREALEKLWSASAFIGTATSGQAMTEPETLKACCAAAYSSDLVALLLGDSYHPGGLMLTRRLADVTRIRAGDTVLDVASGRGTSALMIAREYDARVIGVDLSRANAALATGAAHAAGLSELVTFQVADAERLPLPDRSVDVVVCECALCTFPGKPVAAGEFARVLRPGGRVGITDVIADPERLPHELTSIGAWIACVADARPAAGYAALLGDAGLTVTGIERYDDAAGRMIDQIEARLALLRLTAPERLRAYGIDAGWAGETLASARRAVAGGIIGYGLIVARKDTPPA